MTKPRWLAHFGLEQPPFSKEVTDAQLWVPSSRKQLVTDLVDACRERGHVLLTGEPGVGKTCVLRALRRELPAAGFRLTYCHNATLGRRDFYRQLCLAIGLNPKATAAAVFYAISQHVEVLRGEKVHPIFLLDEAHRIAKMDERSFVEGDSFDSRSGITDEEQRILDELSEVLQRVDGSPDGAG